MTVSQLEQRRRDLKGTDPEFYGYIADIEAAKALDHAGDVASGAYDEHAAANRIWLESARRREMARQRTFGPRV